MPAPVTHIPSVSIPARNFLLVSGHRARLRDETTSTGTSTSTRTHSHSRSRSRSAAAAKKLEASRKELKARTYARTTQMQTQMKPTEAEKEMERCAKALDDVDALEAIVRSSYRTGFGFISLRFNAPDTNTREKKLALLSTARRRARARYLAAQGACAAEEAEAAEAYWERLREEREREERGGKEGRGRYLF